MSNTIFRFKQFTIAQDRSAMKVSTDACVLGSCVHVPKEETILDIGTGTGLLVLMMAQRSNNYIDAVEIDKASYLQAKNNIATSPWRERICIFHADIRDFTPARKYSLIVCNPPFFENHLKSPSAEKNLAKHADHLSSEELLTAVKRLIEKVNGSFTVLLPEKISLRFIEMAKGHSLYLKHRLHLRDNPSRPVIRSICTFSCFSEENVHSDLLTIKDISGNYTSEFVQLLKPFYLKL